MVPPVPPPAPPAATIEDVIARMQAIEAALPASDGLACFNRMYLAVTQDVSDELKQGTFSDPNFVNHLDVVFANIYFSAVDALSVAPSSVPLPWQPLVAARSNPRIEPIQFALAGMNAHIDHDLPIAVVTACRDLDCSPEEGSHRSDYQKVEALLDKAEQAVRESFEPRDVETVDSHIALVLNLVSNWTINSARDIAWDTALALWEVRDHRTATQLMTGALAGTVAMASKGLLVAA